MATSLLIRVPCVLPLAYVIRLCMGITYPDPNNHHPVTIKIAAHLLAVGCIFAIMIALWPTDDPQEKKTRQLPAKDAHEHEVRHLAEKPVQEEKARQIAGEDVKDLQTMATTIERLTQTVNEMRDRQQRQEAAYRSLLITVEGLSADLGETKQRQRLRRLRCVRTAIRILDFCMAGLLTNLGVPFMVPTMPVELRCLISVLVGTVISFCLSLLCPQVKANSAVDDEPVLCKKCAGRGADKNLVGITANPEPGAVTPEGLSGDTRKSEQGQREQWFHYLQQTVKVLCIPLKVILLGRVTYTQLSTSSIDPSLVWSMALLSIL